MTHPVTHPVCQKRCGDVSGCVRIAMAGQDLGKKILLVRKKNSGNIERETFARHPHSKFSEIAADISATFYLITTFYLQLFIYMQPFIGNFIYISNFLLVTFYG